MALRTITLASTVDQWKTNYNSLSTDVGDLSLLGTTHDSNLVLAINELIGEFDSATVQRLARKSVSAGTGIGYDSSTGVISLSTPINTITNAMMADSAIGTAELRNSAVTTVKIATGAVDSNALGALSVSSAKLQASIPDSKLATISTASKVSNSATTATNLNTASAIVARDASGNFTAGTITAALTGNASTATALATGRNFSLTGEVTAPAISFTGAGAVALVTTIAADAVDSSNILALSISSGKIQANAVGFTQMADSAVGSNELRQSVELIIYNSVGTALKTLYGAGV
jgi:hypothetical protein